MPRNMTLTEKIFAQHAGQADCKPGDNLWLNVDVLMTHDVCGPGTIGIFKKEFGQDAVPWDKDRVVIIPDHYVFTADGKAHRNIQILRDFVKQHQLKYYYDPDFLDTDEGSGFPNPYRDPNNTSYKGVCHKALPRRRPLPTRRDPAGHGQPHLHRRGVRAIRHGRGQHRRGVHVGHGQDVDEDAADHAVRLPR